MRVDPNGNDWWHWVIGIGALVLFGVVGAVVAANIYLALEPTVSPSSITAEDININKTNPSGSIEVDIDGSAILITDSYKITSRSDKIAILKIIMASEEYKTAQYSRSLSSYLAEWEVHNHVFYITGVINAQHVNLDKGKDDWYLNAAYDIYNALFVWGI